eukprot:scaffold7807_cov62-Cyclotella_meneghiniana.AAC.3
MIDAALDNVPTVERVAMTAHRPRHKKECKKRAAELKHIELFNEDGPSHYLEDCPICLAPMPVDEEYTVLNFCCMKYICAGCTDRRRFVDHGYAQIDVSQNVCPLCRTTVSRDQRENLQIIQRRVDAGDHVAYKYLGDLYSMGRRGLPVDKTRAVELWTESARLGSAAAHFDLANAYRKGDGVDRSMKLATHHLEIAAKGGHPLARHNLGCEEANLCNYRRALKHWMISAKMGYEKSLTCILDLCKYGDATKDDYAVALAGFRKADDERKSPDRTLAEERMRRMSGTILSTGRVV